MRELCVFRQGGIVKRDGGSSSSELQCLYFTEASEKLSNSDIFVEAEEAQTQNSNVMLLQRELATLGCSFSLPSRKILSTRRPGNDH